jgi:hypothetical protein
MSAWTNTMKSFFTLALSLPVLLPALPVAELSVQSPVEAEKNMDQTNSYPGHKEALQDGYTATLQKIQQLLWKLQHREAKLLKRLAAKDSAAYLQYVYQSLFFDSIATHSKDTSYQQKIANKKNATLDSLKGVQRFIESQQGKPGNATTITNKVCIKLPKELGQLQQLNCQQNIDRLIGQRTASLESLAKNKNINGMEGILKDIYYAREKIRNWKKISDEPGNTEVKALEYLQVTEGFDKYLKQDNNATAADRQRMDFQTKGQINGLLQDKLGNSLNTVQQYTDKLSGVGKG